MRSSDVIVIGGGMSGLGFAYHAERAGRAVLVVEEDDRVGGCVDTRTSADGFWIELGAHTCYNSYGAFIEVLEALEHLDGTRVVTHTCSARRTAAAQHEGRWRRWILRARESWGSAGERAGIYRSAGRSERGVGVRKPLFFRTFAGVFRGAR
jgi:phytoene dehydrogenase-like protein